MRSLQADLRVYKMKCERLVTRTGQLEDELDKPPPSKSPLSTAKKAAYAFVATDTK
jgi:hypothetical protein